MVETVAPNPDGRGKVPAYAEDPWTRVESIHGMAGDELDPPCRSRSGVACSRTPSSLATRCSRQGRRREAALGTAADHLRRGRGPRPARGSRARRCPHRMHAEFAWPGGDRFLFAAHAIRVLATSPKDRMTDELPTGSHIRQTTKGVRPEIPDVALDVHTRRGQLMGRGLVHFLVEGAQVENEVPGRDLSYRKRLLAFYGIPEESGVILAHPRLTASRREEAR